MHIPLVLLALVAPALRPAMQSQCGIDCDAIQAALEWAIDEVPGATRARTYVEIGARPAGQPEPQTPEFRARGRVMEEVAARRGMATVRAGEYAFSHRCLQDLASPPCEPGTTWLAITNSRVTPEGDVLVNLRTTIAGVRDPIRGAAYGNVQELRLRRAGGTWRVVEARVVLIVN